MLPQLPAGHGDVAGLAGAHRQADAVEHLAQVVGGDVLADVDAGLELDALGLELFEPPVDDVLAELEIGDAVAEHAAGLLVLLEDHDAVPGPGQLLCGRQAGGPRADDRDPFARLLRAPAAA